MQKINAHIEIVRSSIPELSSMGEKSCIMLQNLLAKYYTNVGITLVNNISDLDKLILTDPDLVFLGVKKLPLKPIVVSSAMIWASKYLEQKGINYSGSMSDAIALDFSKPLAKKVILNAGLKTSDYFTAKVGQYNESSILPIDYPLFIKPPNEGGGKGVDPDSVVHNFSGFESKVKIISSDFGSVSLVEKFLTGREYSVAILDISGSDEFIAMPIEIVAGKNLYGDRILGRTVKSEDSESVIPVEDIELSDKLKEFAISAYQALGARDYGRIDIRLDENDIPHFLEANLIPGLAYHEFTSYFTSACLISGLFDYETMVLHIVQLGLSRKTIGDSLTQDVLSTVPTK